MSLRLVYLLVEGPHEVGLVTGLLQRDGYRELRKRSAVRDLDERVANFFPTVPRQFEFDRPHDIPSFVHSSTSDVLVVIDPKNGGISRTSLADRMRDRIKVIGVDVGELHATGTIIDAEDSSVESVFSMARGAMDDAIAKSPSVVGKVEGTQPRVGIFVEPDCATTRAALERAVLEHVQHTATGYHDAAVQFVEAARAVDCPLHLKGALPDLERAVRRDKLALAGVTSIFKPGLAARNVFTQTGLIRDPAVDLAPMLQQLKRFLDDLVA